MTYIDLDIRILHTLMYQVDLCYTDSILLTNIMLSPTHPMTQVNNSLWMPSLIIVVQSYILTCGDET